MAFRYINARRISLSKGEVRSFLSEIQIEWNASKHKPVTICDHLEA